MRQGALLLVALTLLTAGCAAASSAPEVGLPGEAIPVLEDIAHIPTRSSPHSPYNSVPPTSGPHVPQTVATGIYRETIPEEVQVHALEHGHVLVQYAPALAESQVRLLEQIARRYPRNVVLAPYDKLPGGIALTAWGRLLRLDQADSKQIEAFIRAFRGRYVHGQQRS